MKTTPSLHSSFNKKHLVYFAGFILFAFACSKEQSGGGGNTTSDVNIFTSQAPAGPTQNDNLGGIELGVKFQSQIAGFIDGVRFFKTRGNIGTHTGELYDANGILLASKVFSIESDSGWQIVKFDTAVAILANTTYIAAYHSAQGNYTSFAYGFKNSIINPPLTGLADGADGANGLYRYTNSPAVPDSGFLSNNYWVDVNFRTK